MRRKRWVLGDALSGLIDHRGKTPKKLGGDWSSSGHRVVSAINIKDRRVDSNDHHYVNEDLYVKWMKQPLRSGDVLLTSEAPTGEVAYLAEDVDWCLGQRLFALRAKPDVLDGRYLYYLLRGGGARRQLLARATGTTVSGIRQAELVQIELDLPSVEEQTAVAATLRSLDDKIDSNRRAVALAESLARSYFERLFDIELNAAGVPVSQLIEINPRRALTSGQSATYIGMSSLPEFSAEIYDWGTKPAGSGQRFTNGDVLMARITPCLENGKTAVVDMLKAGEIAWGSTEYVVLAPQGEISTAWIYCLVRSQAVRSFAIRSMSGTSGRQRFQADRLDQYVIARPEFAALKEFNDVAEPLFASMTHFRNETLRAVNLRDALLPELLSSRIRVPEARVAAQEDFA